MFKYLYILVFILSLNSCSFNNERTEKNISYKYIKINVDDIELSDSIKCSSFLTMPKTILLENKEDAYINRIYELDMFENEIYILDDKSNRLLVFDLNGKYKYRIGRAGLGPGEYISITDFSIDRENKLIYLLDEGKKCILEYNLKSLEFIREIDISSISGDSYCLQYSDGYLYVNQTYTEKHSSKYLLCTINVKTGKFQNQVLNSDEFNNGWNIPLRSNKSSFYSKNRKTPFYLETFSNKVAELNNGEANVAYVIESEDFVDKCDVDKIKEEYYKTKLISFTSIFNSNKIFKICNLIDINKYLYLQYNQGVEKYNLLYNKDTQFVNKAKYMYNDLISTSKPLKNTSFIFSDTSAAISALRMEDLPYFIEEIIAKDHLNKNIDNYDKLKNIDYESNTILFYYKYK